MIESIFNSIINFIRSRNILPTFHDRVIPWDKSVWYRSNPCCRRSLWRVLFFGSRSVDLKKIKTRLTLISFQSYSINFFFLLIVIHLTILLLKFR